MRRRYCVRAGGLWAALGLAAAAMLGGGVSAASKTGGDSLWTDLVPRVKGAKEYYVAPDGKPGNPGTRDAPWDITSALAATQPVRPGDIIWVRGGTYKGQFNVELKGDDRAPIHVRASPGERATLLDNTLTIERAAVNVWIWDLEIATSVPVEQRMSKQVGRRPTDIPPLNGIAAQGGKGCKLINLVLRDNPWVAVWLGVDAIDCELHGTIIYNTGFRTADGKSDGHCIYTQNKDGIKTISGCIMSRPYGNGGGYTLHAYGSSRAYVDNYLVEDNIFYDYGPFLIGGGRPSHGVRAFRNYLYDIRMQIGESAPENEDCEIRDNVIVNGSLDIKNYKKVVNEGNLVLAKGAKRPEGARTVLIPNKYDPTRANVAVFNWGKAAEVKVQTAPFLKPGDAYRLMDPRDFYGRPVLIGKCDGDTITAPMKGEFAAFVLLKGAVTP